MGTGSKEWAVHCQLTCFSGRARRSSLSEVRCGAGPGGAGLENIKNNMSIGEVNNDRPRGIHTTHRSGTRAHTHTLSLVRQAKARTQKSTSIFDAKALAGIDSQQKALLPCQNIRPVQPKNCIPV